MLGYLSPGLGSSPCFSPWSLQPHGLQPTRLLCPWNFPGKSAGVGCHILVQGIFPTHGLYPQLLHLLHWQADSLPLHHLGSTLLIKKKKSHYECETDGEKVLKVVKHHDNLERESKVTCGQHPRGKQSNIPCHVGFLTTGQTDQF